MRKDFLDYFRQAVRDMNHRSPVYRMLKEELSAKGYWRNRPRGKANPQNLRSWKNRTRGRHAKKPAR